MTSVIRSCGQGNADRSTRTRTGFDRCHRLGLSDLAARPADAATTGGRRGYVARGMASSASSSLRVSSDRTDWSAGSYQETTCEPFHYRHDVADGARVHVCRHRLRHHPSNDPLCRRHSQLVQVPFTWSGCNSVVGDGRLAVEASSAEKSTMTMAVAMHGAGRACPNTPIGTDAKGTRGSSPRR